VTVIHQPSLLILDEPFSGLDPVNANLIKDEIYELHQQGTTIIFSTHRMEQVEEICDNIVLINKGKNVLEGEVAEVKQRFKQNLFKIDFIGQLPEALSTKATIIKQYQDSVSLQLLPPFSANDILLFLLQNQVQIKAFNEILPTLNEIFIKQVASANS
jgi:ABC-2 type transport system ATP-binding protein